MLGNIVQYTGNEEQTPTGGSISGQTYLGFKKINIVLIAAKFNPDRFLRDFINRTAKTAILTGSTAILVGWIIFIFL